MGAWIETIELCVELQNFLVAPFMGAWIETLTQLEFIDKELSRTLHGCVD